MPVVILMSGPPGSGKGTQAALLSAWLGIPAISTGELLRAEARTGSRLGQEIAALFARGAYADDELVNQIVSNRLESAECRHGVILDGYPRTRRQSEHLSSALTRLGWPDPWLIQLEVPAEAIGNRLRARRQCVPCGITYNLQSQAPRHEDLCDQCRKPLTQRSDDAAEVIEERLKVYAVSLSEDLNCWQASRRLIFDGNRRAEEVFEFIRSALKLRGDFADRI